MFQSLREEIDALCQEADRLNDKFEQDEWLRAKKSAPAGVNVAEWLASRPKPAAKPLQQQPQQSAGMDQETSDAFNKWMTDYVREYVRNAFDAYTESAVDGIAEAFSLFRAEERKLAREHVAAEIQKLREEIGQLRAEMTLATGIQRGEIAQLKGKADAA